VNEHRRFLARAVAIARTHMRADGGGPFGAVVVREGRIVGEGHNRVTAANDPTAHAEIVAIREACRTLDRFSLAGCTLYASSEPCPMCLGAIYWARLERVYYANSRADAARIGFDDALIYDEIAKPPERRALSMVRLDDAAARRLFDEWSAMPDKIPY